MTVDREKKGPGTMPGGKSKIRGKMRRREPDRGESWKPSEESVSKRKE